MSSNFPIQTWLDGLALAAVVLSVAFTLLWALSLRLRNVAIVDVAWGPAFAVAASCYRLEGPPGGLAQWVGLVAVSVWAARLGLHLFLRAYGEPEDRRYAAMRARDPRFAWTALFKVFGLQALLVLFVSTPLLALQSSEALVLTSPAAFLGLVVFAIGLFFETVSDLQLRRFLANPGNRGRVLDTGLWRWSRHPNYFGDFCVWWGLWLLCLPAPGALWTLPAPLLMSILLMRVSGVTLLERDISERRPGYREYVQATNAFFPGPRRGGP